MSMELGAQNTSPGWGAWGDCRQISSPLWALVSWPVKCEEQNKTCLAGLSPPQCSVPRSFLPLLLGNNDHTVLTFPKTDTRSYMTHRASAILFDVLTPLLLFIYFPPVLSLCTERLGVGAGGFLVPLISTRHRLIKSVSTQGVGGAHVLLAQFKCFLTNFRSFLMFCRVHSSLRNNRQTHLWCNVGLERSQSDPVGGVELPVCSLSREGHEGLEIIKIWVFTYITRPSKIWKCQRHTEWLPFDWMVEKGRCVERHEVDKGLKE